MIGNVPLLRRISRYYGRAVDWPSLEEEVGPYKRFLKGRVLNAGAGSRDLSPLIDGELFNQDLPEGRHNKDIHIASPLDSIPVEDAFFDTVFCNAVLEHSENPSAIVREFERVLKDGGYLYLCVPFMQPEHKDPGDFQRYTQDGLSRLVTMHGFEVVVAEGVHNVYHTLTWIVHEWLRSKRAPHYVLMRLVVMPVLKHRCRRSRTHVHKIASSYRVIARKLPARSPARTMEDRTPV